MQPESHDSAPPAADPEPLGQAPFPAPGDRDRRDLAIAFGLILLAAALLLPGLGRVPLWQDEAETALLARSIAAHGLPVARTPDYVITQNQGLEFDASGVWKWSPWAQFYVAAGSFALLGESATAARLPFALAAAASVGLLYLFAFELSRRRRVALLAALSMLGTLTFLLHARQCRWYALAILATIWLLHATLRMGRGGRGAALHFSAAAALLFHANFVVAAYVLAAVLLHQVASRLLAARHAPANRLLPALAGFALLTLPWALWAEIWSRPNPVETLPGSLLERSLQILTTNLASLNHEILPLLLAIGIPWALTSLRDRDTRIESWLLGFVVVVGLLGVSLLPWNYFRYLIVLLPPACVLAALVLDRLLSVHRALGAAVCAAALSGKRTRPGPSPARGARRPAPLPGAARPAPQRTEPRDPLPPESARSTRELVLTNYGQLPILFHTPLRAVGFGQNLRVRERPDWIIPRPGQGRRLLLQRARGYRPMPLGARDALWGERPDPGWQRIREQLAAPELVVYRRPDPAGAAEPRPTTAAAGSDAERAHLLLITIDTLRADHLHHFGYPRATSPHLDAFAASNVSFRNFFTVSPKTGPSMVSVFTGKLTQRHGVTKNPMAIPERELLLAERLDPLYRTAAFVSNPTLAAVRGYHAGFEEFELVDDTETVARRAERWLAGAGDEPFFLWLHFLDPHGPYQPPASLHERFVGDVHFDGSRRVSLDYSPWPGFNPNHVLGHVPRYQRLGDEDRVDYYIAQYDAEILWVDRQVGAVLEALESAGLEERTLVVLTADHGESLGEHDYYFEHGMLLNEGSIHVPLIVSHPEIEESRQVEALAQNTDLLPTILSLLGLEAAEDIDGVDLSPLVRSGDAGGPGRDFVYASTPYPASYPRFLEAIRTREGKLIRTDEKQLAYYDLRADPAESEDRIGELDPELLQTLARQLEPFGRTPGRRTPQPAVDEALRRQLEALGYVEPPAPEATAPTRSKAAP